MNKIELVPITLDVDYAKKFHERSTDFVHIYKNGEKVSDTLYRTGAFGGKVGDKYFLMIKHIEESYDDSITDDVDRKLHLAGHWCIIDNDGLERVVFDTYKIPYIVGEVIYAVDNNYYNIDTLEFIANCHKSLSSGTYLFLDLSYEKDKSERGILKINKIDGTYELFQ